MANDRLHRFLRLIYSAGGLDEFIQRVSETASDDLAVQLKIYNDLKEADFDEFQSKWQGVQCDMLDVSEVFNVSSVLVKGECPTVFGDFGVKKGRKVAIFGQIWSNFGLQKVHLCCNTVLHLGILR